MSALAYPNDTGEEMKVTVLGTETPYPEPQRFGLAILVEAASQKMLFDCGRGAVIRLSEDQPYDRLEKRMRLGNRRIAPTSLSASASDLTPHRCTPIRRVILFQITGKHPNVPP